MDYTKYVLKSQEELEGMLAGKDNLFVVACNKCFKEFETTQEPDCGCFTACGSPWPDDDNSQARPIFVYFERLSETRCV